MKKIIFSLLMVWGIAANAQFSKASLQASGLTCSMCSKAVKNALEKVSFVEKVQVDIKNQQYNLSFRPNTTVDFDALGKAVEDAGFSVASLKVTAAVNSVQVKKDEHVQIGGSNFHFLNSSGQTLNGDVTFSLVDKGFVSAKAFKNYAALSKMTCVQTGRMAKCCAKEAGAESSRIYHVVI
ncbi:heavy-metal-associated domain-containing protein [Flavisolibacter nicotianae]|uniref:heavy-metal-associated domain-containing protein n=1 Tax=Flavisolibacter nicotianae TaxID=2364882 RepID=UPI000EB171D9|nr:cation transporter [Flavisolibacter nicotianae]